MNQLDINIDDVKQYMLGTMDPALKKKYEEKLVTDATFQKEFHIQKALLEGIRFHYNQQLKHKLQAQDRSDATRLHYWKYSLVAALFLVLLVAGYFLLAGKPTATEIYADYYKAYYLVEGDFKRGESHNEVEAFEKYQLKDFQQAIGLFNQALEDKPDDPVLLFYLGIAHLEEGETSLAVASFNKVVASEHGLKEPAKWYLGLAYLKMEEPRDARQILQEIIEEGGSYKDKAKEILQKL